MGTQQEVELTQAQLARLEHDIDRLVAYCAQLTEEKRSLQEQHEKLLAEHAELVDRGEAARTRVEAMVARLKSLEQG